MFKASLNYYSAYLASIYSFEKMFNLLEIFVKNPEKRFQLCLRVKRGLNETEKPGGMYKD